MLRLRSIVLLCVASLFVTGCTKGLSSADTATTPTTGNGTAVIRFVQGSPDAGSSGTVDFKIDGAVVFSGTIYGTVTRYYTVIAGTPHTIEADTSGTSTVVIPNTSVSPASGSIYSFVLAGKASAKTQQWLSFTEPVYTNTASQSVLNVHHASPYANANGAPTLNFGFSAVRQTNYQTAVSATYPGSATGAGVVYLMPTSAASSPGVQIYAVPSTFVPTAANGPGATLLPSSVDPNDGANVLPSTSGDYHFDIFAVDNNASSTTAANYGINLIAAFD